MPLRRQFYTQVKSFRDNKQDSLTCKYTVKKHSGTLCLRLAPFSVTYKSEQTFGTSILEVIPFQKGVSSIWGYFPHLLHVTAPCRGGREKIRPVHTLGVDGLFLKKKLALASDNI
ncbi:UNVERIFIED_CONTAM: hypothetical protein K2H54_036889 [Gekko kuhli]